MPSLKVRKNNVKVKTDEKLKNNIKSHEKDKSKQLFDRYSNNGYTAHENKNAKDTLNSKLNTKQNINNEYDKILKNQIKNSIRYEPIKDLNKQELIKKKSLNKNRVKLIAGTYASVTTLMIFLILFNVFSISSINTSIENATNNISAEQIKIEKIVDKISDITTEDNIETVASALGFSQIDTIEIVNVPLYEKQSLPTYDIKSNWFDRLTSFLRNLF